MYLPGELISGCRRQAFACPSQGTPGSRWSTSTCVSVSQLVSVYCFQLKDPNESFQALALLLDCLVDSKEGQTNRIPKNLCLTKSTCYPPALSTIVQKIATSPNQQLRTPSTLVWLDSSRPASRCRHMNHGLQALGQVHPASPGMHDLRRPLQ